ncbi:MAG: response regulator, partial [Rectinema sp.]|nr:response regulator [Rectinema sp.]
PQPQPVSEFSGQPATPRTGILVVEPFKPGVEKREAASVISEREHVDAPEPVVVSNSPPSPELPAEPDNTPQPLPQAVDDAPAQEPELAADQEKPQARGLSVLVVDDSEVNREFILRMLALKDYSAAAVPDGESALAMLREKAFDVVLVDCIMPGMDGYTLGHRIREAGYAARLIAMSPRHDPDEEARCSAAGFDGLLVKPFTMSTLDRTLQRVLR